ncbi:hypothetical protein GCM10010502_69970 [Kitasatospora aureofaciens]|uniref:Uncharacterized protein n=1 Tax=Kitasatospora aureofaciens TaxID=1894 RepID=A0A8H9HZ47_KITAU|nr:hypothetical protein GCM10010502_69970 [Kitasatospora aureofaciens]
MEELGTRGRPTLRRAGGRPLARDAAQRARAARPHGGTGFGGLGAYPSSTAAA